jgi:hypothetical protein
VIADPSLQGFENFFLVQELAAECLLQAEMDGGAGGDEVNEIGRERNLP